jgi:hypothetical protein
MHKAFGEMCQELSGTEAREEVDWIMEEHFRPPNIVSGLVGFVSLRTGSNTTVP